MSLQCNTLSNTNFVNPGGYATSHAAIDSSSVNATYQWMQLFANLFGAMYNVNPKLILAILGLESNYGAASMSDPMQAGGTSFMDSMNKGTNILTQKMAAYSSIPSFLTAYNGVCTSMSNGQFLAYGASATYLAMNQQTSGCIHNQFVGYMPSLTGPTCVNLMNTCGCVPCTGGCCGGGPVGLSNLSVC